MAEFFFSGWFDVTILAIAAVSLTYMEWLS